MVVNAETKRSPAAEAGNGEKGEESMFSPRFRSVAEMAGWDEEALLIASLVVEDTPDRQIKHKRRTNLHFKTPPTNSRSKRRRAQKRGPAPIPVAVLNLDSDDESSKQVSEKEKKESDKNGNIDKKMGDTESEKLESGGSAIPCMDRLREELSCAICLEICFEPSTTPCGHSFCKKCLRSAADKCGKRCPKCRQLISNGRSCTVNTVLWNTIQLLFPQEIEARKASGAVDSRESKSQSLETRNRDRSVHAALNGLDGEVQNSERRRRNHNLENRSVRPSTRRGGGDVRSSVRRGGGDVRSSVRRREELPVQDEDAALALRLQREEFMEAFRPSNEQQQTSASLMLARANLRAMASRAINIRARGRQN